MFPVVTWSYTLCTFHPKSNVCPSAQRNAFRRGNAVLPVTDDDVASDEDGRTAFRRPDKKLRYGFHAMRGKRQQRLYHRPV